MKNEDQPDDPGLPWNSEDVVFGGITCKQLSRLCTCFVSALRMANMEGKEFGVEGTMSLVKTLIDQQLQLAKSKNITPEERKIVEQNLAIGLQAVCLAGVFAINQIDARHLTAVAVSTIQIVHKLAEATGPIGPDDEVVIQIRKGEDAYDEEHIEMGVRLESTIDMLEKIGNDNVGKEIKNIVKPTNLEPPDLGPTQQGLN